MRQPDGLVYSLLKRNLEATWMEFLNVFSFVRKGPVIIFKWRKLGCKSKKLLIQRKQKLLFKTSFLSLLNQFFGIFQSSF